MNPIRPGLLRTAVGLLWLGAAAHNACAADTIRIENVTWGFDGKAVVQQFNPLSFEVHNDGADPFEGVLKLEYTTGMAPVDAPVIEPLYLAPRSSRRVTFYPFVLNNYVDFALVWGRGPDRRMTLNEIRLGEPAVVILGDPYDVTSRGGSLPRFDESFFPVSVTGTAGLAGVVLDHEPRWRGEEARQQAFLDWLHAGGTVHLLLGDGAVHPQFRAPLDALNTPLDRFPVGQGLVIRHDITAADMNADYVANRILPAGVHRLKPAAPAAANQDPYQNYNTFANWDTTDQFFSRLRQMTRPDHNWALIYLMSLVYLLVIFPGCWLIGRRRADYRVTYTALIGAVVLFSMGFKAVGQRGYGEETALHAFTVARPVADGRTLIQQWGNLFVTDGDDYRIAHPGDGLLYSSGQTQEAVNGAVKNPPSGDFQVDIPPFSARSLASAAVLKTSPFQLDVTNFHAEGGLLRSLTLTARGELPATIQSVHALYGQQMYTLRREGTTLSLVAADRPLPLFLRAENWEYGPRYSPFFEEQVEPAKLFDDALEPLIARSLGVTSDEIRARTELSPDRARIYLYADMPDELFPVVEYLGTNQPLPSKRAGRVLYIVDVLDPDPGPATEVQQPN